MLINRYLSQQDEGLPLWESCHDSLTTIVMCADDEKGEIFGWETLRSDGFPSPSIIKS